MPVYGNDDVPPVLDDDEGPTDADLAALLLEEPLIEAGIALVDAEIRLLTAERGPMLLDLVRLRRAQARVARETVARAALADVNERADWAA